MNSIKSAWLNIKESKGINIIFMIQMIVVMLLFADVCMDVTEYISGVNRFEAMRQNNAYINSDTTDDKQLDYLWSNENQSTESAQKLYTYIKENFKSYTVWSYNTDDEIQYFTDDLFFEMLDIQLFKGTFPKESDSQSGVTPVIIGYNLKNQYQLGEEYQVCDCSSAKNVKVKIVGVLKNNSTIPSLYEIGSCESLDNAVIFPITDRYLSDFANLDMAINSTVVFTDDKNDLISIEKKSAELNLFSIKYQSIQDNINDYLTILEDKLQNRLILIGIISCFAIFSMVLNMLNLISKKKKDFSIHFMTGATKLDIIRQVIIQVMILFIPAAAILLIYSGLSYTSLISFAFSLVLIFLVVFLPVKMLDKDDIITIYHKEN